MATAPHWLTIERLKAYSHIILFFYGLALALTLVMAGVNGLVDFDGRPLGNDFMAFWSAAPMAPIPGK